MKNFKIVLITCLIISMFAMLVACGGNESETVTDTDTSAATTTEETTAEETTTEASDPSVKYDGKGDDIINDNF